VDRSALAGAETRSREQASFSRELNFVRLLYGPKPIPHLAGGPIFDDQAQIIELLDGRFDIAPDFGPVFWVG
jgi:hypothetical protein